MPQYFGQLETTEQPWLAIGAVQTVERDRQNMRFKCGDACLIITVVAANLIRVRLSPTSEFTPRRSWAVAIDDEQWAIAPFEVTEKSETIQITTEQIKVVINRDPCKISYYDSKDRPFAQDADMSMGWRMGTIAGWKKIEAEEHFYGFGERTGLLDKRSERKTNWTVDALDFDVLSDEMYVAIPFFMALRPEVAYGIFFNTTFWSQFDLGAEHPGTWQLQTCDKQLDYYIIYGPQPAQILATYTQLTGRMPLPPKWAIGYHQCRWSYESEEVVRQIAREFRTRRIPCDVIHFDIDYMRGYRVFTWTPKRFPNPAQLVGDLAKDGFKTVTIIDPGVKYEPEGDYHVFDSGLKNDYFVRKANGQLYHGYVWPEKSVFPDFLRPEVRQWWGDLQQALTSVGVAGIWNDMNEPTVNDRPFSEPGEKVYFPQDAPQGPWDERTTHAEAHNLYGIHMAQACAQGLERLRNGDRSFVLTRSGYAGVQRWSSVWMGDNQSLWEHLEMSLPMLCNMGLSGVAFVGCDVGGFAGNATAELFARWIQVGMLYPFMRGHSAMTTAQHEPWVFGDRTESICREYLNLRYQLLPYYYTLFWQAATTGAPILRPLVYEFPNDPKTYALYDQVMLGSSIMAAPIYRPGIEHRAVYLPAGTWYDWWTGEALAGQTHILAHAPLEKMPLYVRAGSIIPMQPVMQYVGEKEVESLTLRVYPGTGEFTMYEDDGKTFDYKQGAWATTTYKINADGQQNDLEISARVGSWQPSPRQVVIEFGQEILRFNDDGTARHHRF
ncbi:glycoside hydrolase family 31 protein [Aliterella atlantica]|uniref:Alpha-glucosidase n=1 Tax=Aliterella atlantica CENA595 TaxID=1618023 RepID=A0A0D8ZMY1_9CYAN|nr:glycoside hydrolase family 31 protein [Aliterella atlantica]KJH69692.1 alpha-glucosidase [Aliterella atlantica CENA595]